MKEFPRFQTSICIRIFCYFTLYKIINFLNYNITILPLPTSAFIFNFQLLKNDGIIRVRVQFHLLPADKASQQGEQTDTTDKHREGDK